MALLGLAVIFATWKVVSPSPPPLSGYLISTSAGVGVPIFGWIEVPALLPKSETLRDFVVSFHYYAAYGLVAVAALHAGAALKHQFADNHGRI